MTQETPPKNAPAANKPVGLARNTANYGDRDFALYLRRSFAKSMGYTQTMLDKTPARTTTTATARCRN